MEPAVLTGLFALGGVIVGGSVNGWAARETENRKTIASAVAAARLVHLELYDLQASFEVALEDDGDWRVIPEPPLTPVLEQHAATLAPVMTTNEWSQLATLL